MRGHTDGDNIIANLITRLNCLDETIQALHPRDPLNSLHPLAMNDYRPSTSPPPLLPLTSRDDLMDCYETGGS